MQPTYPSARLWFPLWQFLTQPVFSSTQAILNPFQFWHCFYVQYLERCWNYDSVQLLERCWAADMELKTSS